MNIVVPRLPELPRTMEQSYIEDYIKKSHVTMSELIRIVDELLRLLRKDSVI